VSVESSLEAQTVALLGDIDADHIVHADFGTFKPDPPFPRVLYWATQGGRPIRTPAGVCAEWRPYRFWVVAKDASGARAAAESTRIAEGLTALHNYIDLANRVLRVWYERAWDLPQPDDERTHVRVVDFEVLVDLN